MTVDVMDKQTELVNQCNVYIEHKPKLDAEKKVCDASNKAIKGLMKELEFESFTVGKTTVKLSTSVREDFNEEEMASVLVSSEIPTALLDTVVKYKPSIDFDALENAIYNGLIPTNVLLELDRCKTTKVVENIRLSKVKEN